MPQTESRLLYSLEDYKNITGHEWLPHESHKVLSIKTVIHIDTKTKELVWDKTGGHCSYCGLVLNPFRNFSVDHVIPQSKGGTDDFDNLVPACRHCNSSKNNRSPVEYGR
jgi:5-methylcytosine-specific restriction endonuclease McrA